VIGDIELFAQTVTAPVIAVTGSNGKSTVATMVYEMATTAGRDVRLGGNVGTPALDLIADGEPDLFVLELSSFQLETTESLDALAAVVLNVTPDHMDRYSSLGAYANAKRRVFAGTGAMILNADDPVVAGFADPGRENIFFTLGSPRSDRDYGIRDIEGVAWLCRGRSPLMRADALGTTGRHNVANALAATALGSVAGLSDEAMEKALMSFSGLAHRMETVVEQAGIRWVNDSKATNVGATLAAVRGFAEPVVLIAGGDGKGADFTGLADTLADALSGRVRQVVLLGRDAERLEQAIGGRVPTVRVGSMDDAVKVAGAQAQKGDVVLLSPACSSLDMFDDFTQRGDVFKTAVRRWTG
jgi:UDP-N-acetylmuramoylalanine--D-glutamate ligase